MSEPPADKPFAWQPLTPAGVAAFAGASWGRLLVVQLIVALCAAGAVVWFLHADWFPVVQEAITELPDQGAIRGKLEWNEPGPTLLANNHFLAMAVDLEHQGEVRSPAHMQVEFGRSEVRIYSLFGFQSVPYSPRYTIAFNRPELEPWWGAWAPALLGMTAGAVVAGLLLTWTLLACAYFWVVWVVAFFANRQLDLRGSWCLAGAALMPGALLQTGAIVAYGLGLLDPVQLLALTGLHFVLGWAYLLLSVFWTPLIPAAAAAKANPFVPAPQSQEQSK